MRGLVQGVGFRPFVWRLANDADLRGEVLNDAEGVIIRLAASKAQGASFGQSLRDNMPPLARIDAVELVPITDAGWQGFGIAASGAGRISTGIVPDAATCPDCLADISNPQNRRFGYAFTNCTNCGPRLSITCAIPYDRANTSMSAFEMCAQCQSEYDDPADRRFHAQPNACPKCGPRLELRGNDGRMGGDPLKETVKALKAGKIVAIKGLGGFQLAVDAGNAQALARLRQRKHRPAKPLALMARDVAMAGRYVILSDTAKTLLNSSQSPIVLARIGSRKLPLEIAPDQNRLGFMLPNTPLHHMLMARLERPIVLTSANLTNEPQVTDNNDALTKLAGIADLWLLHDRDIINRLDDSVVQIVDDTPHVLRRARGYAPAPLRLHPNFANTPAVLATGADLKNTFCLLKDGQAIVSQHMGNMENPETQRDFVANLDLYRRIYDFTPVRVAVDLHPGYFSTRLGQQIAADDGLTTDPVQHHHAHIAAVLAEHGFAPDTPPVLGIVLDGLGYGGDGTIWGGEFLLADFHNYKRLAHFLPVALPGGEKANRQPWRNTMAHLLAAFGPDAFQDLADMYGDLPAFQKLMEKPAPMIGKMIAQGLNAPLASSAGRLFDAVATLLGGDFEQVEFEGQAAMWVQSVAETCPQELGVYKLAAKTPVIWRGLWEGILDDLCANIPTGIIAARFHNSLIQVISNLALKLAKDSGTEAIVLSGGVMQNAVLKRGLTQSLIESGLCVYSPNQIPVNDGGIALGQAAIVAAQAKSKYTLL